MDQDFPGRVGYNMEAITETFLIANMKESQKSGHLSNALFLIHYYL